jgi:glucose-fructose oxidoreductase
MNTTPRSPGAITRRDFVGQLSLGAAALALAPRSRGEAAPPARKLGVALVGLGSYATGQLGPALKLTEHCRLTGVVTGSRAKGEKWAKDYGFSERNIYDYATMHRLADNPDIDIVYVVTPNSLHAEEVVIAAKAGKHVICEKPFTTNVADAERAIAACKAAKVKLSIGYRLHFDPYHEELRRLAREKDYGAFTKVTGGFSFVMRNKVWRAERKLAGGGPIMDLGVYFIQGACMAANGAAPIAVTAKEGPKTRPDIFTDVEETMNWTMEFADGLIAEGATCYQQSLNQIRAEAPKGYIELRNAFSYNGITGGTTKGELRFVPPVNQQARQMDDFAQCVRDGRESRVSGEMGLRDMKIIAAIYEAARTGKRTLVKV